MTPHEATAAWLRMASPGAGDLRRLIDVGVSSEAMYRSGGLATARVKSKHLWEPDVAGRPMLVTPVWNGPAPSIFQAIEYPMVIDLIAWVPTDPDAMYRRTGAGAVLGEEYLDIGLAGEPIRLFPNILEWLRADCGGIVPLNQLLMSDHTALMEVA